MVVRCSNHISCQADDVHYFKQGKVIPVGKSKILKEQCHEDFAVLSQFCTKIITLRLKSYKTTCFCKAMTKISNEFYQRGLTIINFLRIFGTRSIKIFQISIHFHPCHP